MLELKLQLWYTDGLLGLYMPIAASDVLRARAICIAWANAATEPVAI